MEDDDTKNVRFIDGLWTISQRDKVIYRAVSYTHLDVYKRQFFNSTKLLRVSTFTNKDRT